MSRRCFTNVAIPVLACAMVTAVTLVGRSAIADRADNLIASRDPFGQLRTFTTNGVFDSKTRSSRTSVPTAEPASLSSARPGLDDHA